MLACLERPIPKIDKEKIRRHFEYKSVLVTGGAGSIGSELCHTLFEFGVGKVVAFDNDDSRLHNLWLQMGEGKQFISYIGDVRDEVRVEQAMKEHRPEIVFHMAALKHVPLLELNVEEGIKTNMLGTQNVIVKALYCGAQQFINISTDKASNPTSVLGLTKYLAERYCSDAAVMYGKDRVMSVRFGNIYGSRGSVVPTFQKQIEKGGPVVITSPEMERYFIMPKHAILLTLQACLLNESPDDIFLFDMGDPVNIYDLAQHLVKVSGKHIPYAFTHPRPGEKINEDLIGIDEYAVSTDHEEILRIKDNVEVDVEKVIMNSKLKEYIFKGGDFHD